MFLDEEDKHLSSIESQEVWKRRIIHFPVCHNPCFTEFSLLSRIFHMKNAEMLIILSTGQGVGKLP